MIRERSPSSPLAPHIEDKITDQMIIDMEEGLKKHRDMRSYIAELKRFALDMIHQCLRKMKNALDGGYLRGIRDAALTLKIECGKVGASQLWHICDQLQRSHDIGNYVWMERLYEKLLIGVIKVKYLTPVILLSQSSNEKKELKSGKLPELTRDEQRRIDLCVISEMTELLPEGYEIVKENQIITVKKKQSVRQAKFSSDNSSCCEGCPIF